MKSLNFILIFSSIVCLSVPINTEQVKIKTTSDLYDQSCNKQLKYFDNALTTREPWRLKVDYGDFDQCVELRHESNDTGLIQGKHCIVRYKEKNSNTEDVLLTGAICLPASCSTNEIISYIKEFLGKNSLFVPAVENQDSFCHTNNRKPFSVIDFIAIFVLSFLVILLVLSSSYEFYMNSKKRKPHDLYVAFSVFKNCKNLFDVSNSEHPDSILCLHGLRALSIIWIMVGHRYVLTFLTPISNPSAYNKWMETVFSAIVNSHPMAADTFFVLSGLLLTWSLMKNLDSGNFGVLKMYLHRYLRLTPVYGCLILLVISLFRHIGSGPFNTVDLFSNPVSCTKYWWSALLHIQNYVNPQQICLLHSWYLSVDFQLALLSPVIVYPAWKYGWKFLWTLPVFITLTEFCTLMIALKYDMKAFQDLNSFELMKMFKSLIYYPTHIRMGAWLVGVMVGYQLYKIRNKKTVINKTANIVMWILSIGTVVAVVIGLLPLQQKEHIDTKIGHAFYLAFTRNNFAYALSWIICACQVGTGGIVRWFLSLSCWKPLGKMGLSFYLVHVLIQAIVPNKQPIYFNDATVLYQCLGDFMASLFFATILYLTLEAPILVVEKYIYKNQQDWIIRLKSRTKL